MRDSEINEAVVRKLGWFEYKDPHYGVITKRADGSTVQMTPMLDFCHSIEAAWEIVEHVGKSYRYRNLWFTDLNRWQFEFGKTKIIHGTEGYEAFMASADTAPMAICLAFLKLP